MTLNELNEMGAILRSEVNKYCRGSLPTLDEVWSLKCMIAGMLFQKFNKPNWRFNEFYCFISNSVEKEISKIFKIPLDK